MLAFLVTATLIELTPGPNMSWLALLGAAHGRLAALAAVAGIALGLAIAGAAAAFGMAVLLDTVPAALMALRYAGTLYLVYLALDTWLSADGAEAQNGGSRWSYFLQGLISNVINPKAYLFYAAVLPRFLSPGAGLIDEIAVLTLAYVAVATVIHSGIALASGSLSGVLARAASAASIRRFFAIAILATAVWLFLSTAKA
jgi:threonine/homoserine/homoserine lactone efflux protein